MILEKIIKKKKLFIDEYMDFCLYKFKESYYQKKNIFGLEGDFVTSPHISSIFSEMLSIWIYTYWENIGKPKQINILELGPGDGTMAKDIIITLKKIKNFNSKIFYYLFETSKNLKEKQKSKLNKENVYWVKDIKYIKKENLIILSNEFFDSLPTKQFIKKENIWLEKGIKYCRLKKCLKFYYEKAKISDLNEISKFYNLDKSKFIEISFETKNIIKKISYKLKKKNSIFLTIDYGDFTSTSNDTLQAIKDKNKINPLKFPGECDITTQVNFFYMIKLFKSRNFKSIVFTTQSEFLQSMGIKERFNSQTKILNKKKLLNLNKCITRLINPKKMGDLFKVLIVKN